MSKILGFHSNHPRPMSTIIRVIEGFEMSPSHTFIYALKASPGRPVKYVGKSDRPKYRLLRHWFDRSGKSTLLRDWLSNLSKRPVVVVLERVLVSAWRHAERKWIAHYKKKGNVLVNTAKGGGGATSQSVEARRKISVGNRGKKHSLDTRRRMSLAKIEGVRPPKTKLCEAGVRAIRKYYAEGAAAKSLARRFGVSSGTVCRVVRYASWRHVA